MSRQMTHQNEAVADLALSPRVVVATGDNAINNLTDSDRFAQLQRVAKLMGASALTPQHLKGKTPEETMANCFRVVNQAMRWGFDPFAVGDETYVVRGKLGYQGKLVAAVINARAGLVGRLSESFDGSGDNRVVTISGQFANEDRVRTIQLSVAQAKTDNAMWTKDPDQKLFYSGVTKWARRHCPELILGVMTVEDLQTIAAGNNSDFEESPKADISDRLAAAANGNGTKEPDKPAEAAKPAETKPAETKPAEAAKADKLPDPVTPALQQPAGTLFPEGAAKPEEKPSEKAAGQPDEAWMSDIEETLRQQIESSITKAGLAQVGAKMKERATQFGAHWKPHGDKLDEAYKSKYKTLPTK